MSNTKMTVLAEPFNPAQVLAGSHRTDFEVIANWTPQGAHVLDLCCGEGTLLHKLITERGVCPASGKDLRTMYPEDLND